MPLFIQVNVSYQFQSTVLIFKNRALGTVGKMMNIKIIELWELINFFHCRKEGNYFCTQDVGVIFRGFHWKCSPLSGISLWNIKKQFYRPVFFSWSQVECRNHSTKISRKKYSYLLTFMTTTQKVLLI